MLDRRNILKFLLAGTAASLLTPLPWKLLDDSAVWTQNWPWIPAGRAGEVSLRRTASKLCPSASGVRVQLVGGRAVRMLPDPEHPLSLGGISALAVAEARLLYSPARVRTPLRRDGSGNLQPISADEAMRLFVARLQNLKAKAGPDRFMCLCGDENSSLGELLSVLTGALKSRAMYFMPSEVQPQALAARAFGVDGLPVYDLESSDLIICVGADLLGNWGTVMRNNQVRATAWRPGAAASSSRLIYCGPARTATALAADQWLALKPGTEAVFLLGLARALLHDQAPAELAAYTLEKVSAATGASLKGLREVVQALGRARRPLLLTGSLAGQGGSKDLARLGFMVNRLAADTALSFMPGPEPVLAGAQSFTALACRDIYALAGAPDTVPRPDMLVCYDANPVYALPAAVRARLGLREIPFKVAFSSFLDETALASDLVFPLPLGLERLDDVYTPFGSGRIIYNICPPIVAPACQGPPPAEVLLAALGALGVALRSRDGRAIAGLHDVLKARAGLLNADFRSLLRGEFFATEARALPLGQSFADMMAELRRYAAAVAAKAGGEAAALGREISLAPLTHPAVGTAVSGIAPFSAAILPEQNDQIAELPVYVNAATARSLNLKAGQRVRLGVRRGAGNGAGAEGGVGAGHGLGTEGGAGAGGKSDAEGRVEPGSLLARLVIFEGLMDNALGLPLGYGHAGFDAFSQGGANGLDLFSLAPDLPPDLTPDLTPDLPPDPPPDLGPDVSNAPDSATQAPGRHYHLAAQGLWLKGA